MASLFDNFLEVFNLQTRAKTLPDKRPVDPSSAAYFVAPSNYSGVDVSEISSLNLSAVFACVRAISDSMASLPLVMYRKDANGRKVRADHDPRYWVLKEQANQFMSAFECRQALFSNLLLWGVAYAELEHDERGRVVSMFPVRSDRVKVALKDNELLYTISIPGGEQVTLPSYRVHTFKLLTLDGFTGVSPIKLAASSLGLTMAAEQYGARYFASGGSVAGIVKHPTQLSEEAFQRLEKSFAGGLSDSHKIRILEEGMEYQSISLDSESMQFLETRQFQTNEIARWFRVPPSIIGDLTGATFNNSEQQMIQFVQNCLRPLASAHEQALRRDILVGDEKQDFDIEYSFDDLLRGDTTARFEAYRTGVNNGILSINEARKKENLPEVEHGDSLYMPLQVGKVNDSGGIDAPTPVEVANREGVQNWTELRSEPETRDSKEERQLRALERRESLAENFREPLQEVIERSVKKSVRDIRKQIQSGALLNDPSLFFTWLKSYESELSPFLVRSLLPILKVLFREVLDSASKELDKEQLGFGEAFEQWVTGYAERYGTEFNERTYEQLFALVHDSEDATGAVETRLTEWETDGHRAQKEASQEGVNFVSAAAIAAYQAYNVSRITWRANAGACSMCRQLDGKTVGIKETFINKNDSLKDGEQTVQFSRNIRHAPLHSGCACGVVASE